MIQTNKNIERVQEKQQDMILKWNLNYDKLYFGMTLELSQWQSTKSHLT